LPLRAYAVVTALKRYVIIALYSVLIVTNSQSVFLPLFIMTFRINFTILDSNLYLRLMEGGAIARSHCILLIRATILMNICIVPSTTLYTEEDPHQGSKRLYL